MDKLNALKYFCTAADTLQFRETAQRLSVSPQMVTRVIAELEAALGAAFYPQHAHHAPAIVHPGGAAIAAHAARGLSAAGRRPGHAGALAPYACGNGAHQRQSARH